MYHSLVMNKNILAEQPAIIDSIYFGNLRHFVENYMNIYQLIVYGGVIVYLVWCLKKNSHIESHIILIGIFGGFLFSIIWEAKTRNVFPYFIMMLTYAAIGLQKGIQYVEASLKRRYTSVKEL